jgi:hypothetical protein
MTVSPAAKLAPRREHVPDSPGLGWEGRLPLCVFDVQQDVAQRRHRLQPLPQQVQLAVALRDRPAAAVVGGMAGDGVGGVLLLPDLPARFRPQGCYLGQEIFP